MRKKAERAELKGIECVDCRKFYAAIETWGAPGDLPACGHAVTGKHWKMKRHPLYHVQRIHCSRALFFRQRSRADYTAANERHADLHYVACHAWHVQQVPCLEHLFSAGVLLAARARKRSWSIRSSWGVCVTAGVQQGGGPGVAALMREQLRQDASRHRYRYEPPATPAGFWDLGFMDSLVALTVHLPLFRVAALRCEISILGF